MAQTKVGRILPAAKGTHNPELGYEQLDIVMSPDGSEVYMAKQTVPAGTELTDTDYWMVYAQMGKVFEELSAKIDATIGQTVTPQMYGAVGDGESDDGSAFEQALASGKNVYVPAGTYKIGRMLTIPSGVKMCGDSIISKYTAMVDNEDKNAETFNTGKDSILIFDGLEECIRYGMKVELSGLVINGSNRSKYGVTPDLNTIINESNCVFKDLLIYNCAKTGLTIGRLEGDTGGDVGYNNYIYRVNCAYCETGLWINASDNTVVDSQFFRNKLFGFQARHAQNFIYNTLSFHNAEAADGGDPAAGAEARFNVCTETYLYACAFDSGILDVGVRMTGGCDIKMHNCRIKGSDKVGIYCDTASRVMADYLVIDNDTEGFTPIQSNNADKPSLLRDPQCSKTEYKLNSIANVLLVDSFSDNKGGAVESVNDKTGAVELAYDDLKDRPFYEGVETGFLIPETALAVTEGQAFITSPPAGKPTAGENYTVMWNGTSYTCVTQEVVEEGLTGYFLGNMSVMDGGEDTGEPFLVMFMPDEVVAQEGVYVGVYAFDGSEYVTFSVNGPYSSVKKIDEKYLPPSKFYITLTATGEANRWEYDKTDAEILAALAAKMSLAAKWTEENLGVPVEIELSYVGKLQSMFCFSGIFGSKGYMCQLSDGLGIVDNVDIVNPLFHDLTFKGSVSGKYNPTTYGTIIEIPDHLPNPNALTFTGAVTGSYDGSSPVTINIPEVASGGTEDAIPSYWQTHLDERVDEIRAKMEAAGRNKSAFLWYSDIHWGLNTKMSPRLLKYLHKHTPINKTNFGGDAVYAEPTVVTDRETMEYLWEWRSMIRDLPNHHSVIGNHDDGNTTNNIFPPEYIYAYLMAGEETQDIVRGGDFYYYIDDRNEKTRYLYLDTGYNWPIYDAEQMTFIKESLMSTPEGWHIVPMAHIWLAVDYDQNPPVVVGMSDTGKALLDIFDAYNWRSGDYANAKGMVEFCIGAHSHVDGTWISNSGIPIILTETDAASYAVRSGLDATEGTTNESAVSAVIADYNAMKVHVVRVGRGSSFSVDIERKAQATPSYTNLLPTAKDADGSVYNGIGYKPDTRLSSSGPADEAGWCLSGYIEAKVGDVLRFKNVTWQHYTGSGTDRGGIYYFDSAYTRLNVSGTDAAIADTSMSVVTDSSGNITQLTIPSWAGSSVVMVRICCQQFTADSVITKNETIG